MKQKIAQAAFLVREYDEAIAYFTEKLDFRLVEDTDRGEGKRWVLVAPPGSVESCLLLARADSAPAGTGRRSGRAGGFFSSCTPTTSGATMSG